MLSTYIQTLFTNALQFVHNHRALVVGTSAHRIVRTNVGSQQWFRSSTSPSSKCYPVNDIIQYQGKMNFYQMLESNYFPFS